jgi:hypothetical protein
LCGAGTGASRRSISRVWFQASPGPCGSAGSGCRSNSAATSTVYGVVGEHPRAARRTEPPRCKVPSTVLRTCVCYIREASTTSWSSHQLAKSGAARTSSVRGRRSVPPYLGTIVLLLCLFYHLRGCLVLPDNATSPLGPARRRLNLSHAQVSPPLAAYKADFPPKGPLTPFFSNQQPAPKGILPGSPRFHLLARGSVH